MRASSLPVFVFLFAPIASAQTVRRVPAGPVGMDLRIGAIGSALCAPIPMRSLVLPGLGAALPTLATPAVKAEHPAPPSAALSLFSAAEDIKVLADAKAAPSQEKSAIGRVFDNSVPVSHNAQAVSLEGARAMPEAEWKGPVRALIYPVQFSKDPAAEAGRVVALIAKGPKYAGKDKKELLAAIEQALADSSDLSKLIPQDHPEPTLRAYLEALAQKLRGS